MGRFSPILILSLSFWNIPSFGFWTRLKPKFEKPVLSIVHQYIWRLLLGGIDHFKQCVAITNDRTCPGVRPEFRSAFEIRIERANKSEKCYKWLFMTDHFLDVWSDSVSSHFVFILTEFIHFWEPNGQFIHFGDSVTPVSDIILMTPAVRQTFWHHFWCQSNEK